MDWLYTIILGIVEGITEFLPISSTGHLILTGHLLTIPWSKEVLDAFEVVIQGGAILSVLVYYWREFWQIRTIGQDREQQQLWLGVVVACLPAVVLGVLLGGWIKETLFRPSVVAWALIVGGLLMWWLESRPARAQVQGVEQIGLMRSLWIGVLQCLALLWPGFSRSASSILGGMLLGLDRRTATQFSFYLGVPTLGGAALKNLYDARELIFKEIGLANVLIGGLTSFVVAYIVIGWLLKFVSSHSFKGFAVYRVVVGVLILVLIAAGYLSNGHLA